MNFEVKVKGSRYRPGVAQRVGTGIALSSMTAALEGGELSEARPGRTLPPGKTRYPFYMSWFYYRNNIKMHGPMNVKYIIQSLYTINALPDDGPVRPETFRS